MKNILISTLGSSWQIIPETIGAFFYDDCLDFYGIPPEISIQDFRKVAKQVLGNESIDELWLISTDQCGYDVDPKMPPNSLSLKGMLEKIVDWRDSYEPARNLVIRVFVLQGVLDISSKEDVEKFHNLALLVLFNSKIYVDGGKRIVSLACGRKTMSADIQDAAYCFGCDMMMHVTASGDSRVALDSKNICLDENGRKSIFPVELKPFPASDLFNEWYDGDECKQYKLPLNDDSLITEKIGKGVIYLYNDVAFEYSFLKKVQEKRESARHFYSSYWSSEQYSYDNFPILYTLSSNTQTSLKNFKLGVRPELCEQELRLLQNLPKADLHCHLGGVLFVSEIIEVAETLEDELANERAKNQKFRNNDLKGPEPGESWKGWRARIATEMGVTELMVVVAFVLQFKNSPETLDEIVYGPQAHKGKDFRDEKEFVSIAPQKQGENGTLTLDLDEYEALGDLQGSGLLTHEKTIRRTVQILFEKSQKCGVKYIEIRCSPINYGKDYITPQRVVEIILDEMKKAYDCDNSVKSSLIFIASRHGDEQKIKDSIKLYNEMKANADFVRFFRGFDLAGNESKKTPKEIRDLFEPILGDCLNVTVHAGETMPAENVWQAVYWLNAERVGHGLTLIDRKDDLIPKFRDRRIGIEMCPSSNYQVVGYCDNYYAESSSRKYPLRDYIDKKLLVCINTDNPGISRTDMVKELHKAARLTRGGLSLWEIFGLLYNSFDLAFLPYDEKIKLLNDMNQQVKNWLDVNVSKIENGTIYEK